MTKIGRLFNRPIFKTIADWLHRLTIPIVITGIVLSTLHQSSLGSLFLIMPHRVHPLWYSPIIWILFFVSAIGGGGGEAHDTAAKTAQASVRH